MPPPGTITTNPSTGTITKQSNSSQNSTNSKNTTITTVLLGIVSVIAIGMFIAAFVTTSQMVGSKDDWNLIQAQVVKILVLTLIGTVCFTIAIMIFCHTLNPTDIIYVLIPISCLSIGLSYSALAISAISR